ncbi:MAG: cytoplasmic protein [Rhodobacteraceae bacterium]|nr:cytoplasmic protein [Paracoccaceae bacterium]
MALPLMRKATAVWLVENTSLTFKQISQFCGLHDLEVSGIADGEVANGIRGMDPIISNQLTQEEIEKCEKDPNAALTLTINPATKGEQKRRGPRYTPLSKRQDKPAAIAWLVKFHAELTDPQIIKLVGTTKPTIQAVKTRTHWNITNIVPTDPVVLGLCKQVELEMAIDKSQKTQNKTSKDSLEKSENKLASIIKPNEDKSRQLQLEKGPFLEDKKRESTEDGQSAKDNTLLEAEKLFNKDGV